MGSVDPLGHAGLSQDGLPVVEAQVGLRVVGVRPREKVEHYVVATLPPAGQALDLGLAWTQTKNVGNT